MNSQLKYISPKLLKTNLATNSLHEFVKLTWHIIEPATEFVDNWHIKAICEYLEACNKGIIRNLIINIPPRHMKSLLICVFLPAWLWCRQPEKKFLFITHREDLAIRDSITCRDLITSDFYQDRWDVRLRRDQNQKSAYTNTEGGYRKSFGLGGGVVGEGGDWLIVDDPLKPSEAQSEKSRNSVNMIYDSTISTRLNNPKTGVKLLIMQRLHEDDLSSHLLDSDEEWEHLCLPAEYEGIRFVSKAINFIDPRTKNGELLWKDRFGKKEIKAIKSGLSALDVAGQLQQRPSVFGGSIFQEKWVEKRVNNTDIIARYISADTAQSIKMTADYNSIIVGELTSNYQLFIREVVRKRLDFTDLQAEIERIAKKYKHKLKGIIIESKSSGISLQQSISKTSPTWMQGLVVPWNPQNNKIQRFFQAAIYVEKGCIILPPPTESYPWLFEFLEEYKAVPNSKNDDQIDAFSQLIIFLENYLAEGLKYRKNKKE